jgi:hypothetical protein
MEQGYRLADIIDDDLAGIATGQVFSEFFAYFV